VSVYKKTLQKGWNSTSAVLDFKKAHDSIRREVLYDILIEFGITGKVVRLIKMHLNETCNEYCIGKNLCLIRFMFTMV
jgi:hypothetical protein